MTTTTEVIDAEPAQQGATALVRQGAVTDVALLPVMDVTTAKRRLEELQDFCRSYLEESKNGGEDGGDYGTIPGAGNKKVLFKSGAEKLCDIYGLSDQYLVIEKTVDYDTNLFDYTLCCQLSRRSDGLFVGSGIGSCSSFESKYRWRQGQRLCPECGAAAIIRGKEQYGGGWICFKKKNGCGAKFPINDERVSGQNVGRIENEDLIDQKNTILKMAKKRAKIDAVISVTRSSGIFTQDIDPTTLGDNDHDLSTKDEAPRRSSQSGETHAERTQRVQAEAKARAAATQQAVGPNPPTSLPPQGPTQKDDDAPTEAQPPTPASVKGIVVRRTTGKPRMVDGKQVVDPGKIFFVVEFNENVRASNGAMVASASTADESVAKLATDYRDQGGPVYPVIMPGSRSGVYLLKGFASGITTAPASVVQG